MIKIKDVMVGVFLALLINIVLFFGLVFVTLEINPILWGSGERSIFAILAGICFVLLPTYYCSAYKSNQN